jgi:hypothetical protein
LGDRRPQRQRPQTLEAFWWPSKKERPQKEKAANDCQQLTEAEEIRDNNNSIKSDHDFYRMKNKIAVLQTINSTELKGPHLDYIPNEAAEDEEQ